MADIHVTAKVRLPNPPNFLCYDGGQIDVADLTDEDLRRVAAAMSVDFIGHATDRRKQPKFDVKPRG